MSSSKKYDKRYWIFNKAKGFKGEDLGRLIGHYCSEEIYPNNMGYSYKTYYGYARIAVFKSINDNRYLLCAFSEFGANEIAVKTYENKTELHAWLRDCYKKSVGSVNWLEAIVDGIGGGYADQDYCR